MDLSVVVTGEKLGVAAMVPHQAVRHLRGLVIGLDILGVPMKTGRIVQAEPAQDGCYRVRVVSHDPAQFDWALQGDA